MSLELKGRISSFQPNKGGKGCVCVIGGSFEYSGAPFFAAISALRTGIDLSFIICDYNAANVIKTYSPELIVFGLLDRNCQKLNVEIPIHVKNRISALIVGPGLSRDENLQDQVKNLLLKFNKKEVPIIFDGDGITLFKNNATQIGPCFSQIVLTPNANEFKLLDDVYLDQINCVIYAKGKTDKLINRSSIIEVEDQGCPRRCGGIGDVLSGTIAAVISMHGDSTITQQEDLIQCILLSGKLVRMASRIAFEKKKRSMSALDVIENLNTAFEQIFE